MIEKMQDIASRQKKLDGEYKQKMKDALGKNPEDMTPEEKKNVEAMKKDQDELKKDTENALNQMENKADKMAKSDETSRRR